MPDYLPGCVEKVKAKNGKLCSWDNVCKIVQDNTDVYCKNRLDHDGTPFDEPVPNVENGKPCFCCCSCFAQHTPIEVSPGEFVAVRDIETRDFVLSGFEQNGQMQWQPSEIVLSNGIGPKLEFDYMYYVQYMSGEFNQQMIVTVDHLFLLENGKVKPVQYLNPQDRLRRPDGTVAEVLFVLSAKYVGGVHHVSFAGFDNTTLNGHLLSANGVITSDYSVQLAYSAGQLNPALLDRPAAPPLRVGTAEYAAQFENPAQRAFLADPERWPAGLEPLPRPLINVPATARAFFTEAQARQLQAAAPSYPANSSINMATLRWLMNTIYGSYRPKTTFLLDWENPLPNIYGWQGDGTTYVLVTGGLALIEGLQYEGLALMMAHGIAAGSGLMCVGPADYDAVFSVLRMNWSNALFFDVFAAGLDQVTTLFSHIQDSEANPDNICNQPSLQCRLDTYNAALSMMPLPACATPVSAFSLEGAKAGRALDGVVASFSLSVDVSSAESTDNYTISPEDPTHVPVTVDSAIVRGKGGGRTVRLLTTGLQPGQNYELSVDGVQSKDGASLNPQKRTAVFTTP
ncbi:hypothetical protein [Paracidovorax cattleyae]|uniref:Intein N-terminal splicing region n=1 Tax=Paracidovorax cattleyae TaxID=80868 RepID=A0A1H0U6Z3_9BURK|nr:hypothetical protein [Paracidovorax cattleyae]MBF9264061.1 hypothetical protein [Paracidovorax cattleyae]SDP61830.1 hypothetical protein SAMN04489708_11818 [Paracidovorax cattleyae]